MNKRDRPELGENLHEPRVTLRMLDAGMAAYRDFDPDLDDPYALVWSILYRAEKVRLSRGGNSGL